MALLFALPLGSYMIYNFFAANGVMQNAKASSGAYAYFAYSWLQKPKSMTTIYRPELENARQQGALFAYTKKIEGKRAEGSLPEATHHPSSWL